MSKMNFDHKWIALIMACVTIVSYSILVDEAPQPSFKPSRGIRQRDPLSPYLLIICVEALSCLLSLAELNGNLTNVLIGRGLMHINHIFCC